MKSPPLFVTALTASATLVLTLVLWSGQRSLQADLARLQEESAAQERQLTALNQELGRLQQTTARLAQLAVTHERVIRAPATAQVTPTGDAGPGLTTPLFVAPVVRPAPARMEADRSVRLPRGKILVNGQELKVDGKAVDEADLRDLPPSRFERIEILPATPGVEPSGPTMNVVLREEQAKQPTPSP